MDTTQGAMIATGILAGITALAGWFVRNYKKDYDSAIEYIQILGTEKTAVLGIIEQIYNLYQNGKAAAADGKISPAEFERIGRAAFAILESNEVKKFFGGK